MLPSRIFFDNFLDDIKENDKMKCDIYEKDNIYHIEADIPGFNKEDINVEFNKGNLTITAEKNTENDDKDKNYLRRERYYGKYQRSFYLGDIDEENSEATFNNGILKISIPKKLEEENKRKIEIK
jgi:HSP20 family protein